MAKTFKAWQVQYPDALQGQFKTSGELTEREAMLFMYGPDKEAKLLYHSASSSGKKHRSTFIFSQAALTDDKKK